MSCLGELSTADVYHRLLEDAASAFPCSDRESRSALSRRVSVVPWTVRRGDRRGRHPRGRSILAKLYELDNVSWIAIAADEHNCLPDLEGGLESRVRRAETLILERYSIDELVDILGSRVEPTSTSIRSNPAPWRRSPIDPGGTLEMPLRFFDELLGASSTIRQRG